MIVALVIGTLLAVGALGFVLYPIFFADSQAVAPVNARRATSAVREGDMRESAVAALREIEFDRATGKLSDVDYRELKDEYTRQAILAMREADRTASDPPAGSVDSGIEDDEIEAAVRAYRAQHLTCPTCGGGPRPESDAVFCSTCGQYLHDRCADCGAPVVALDARYCTSCGNRLAA